MASADDKVEAKRPDGTVLKISRRAFDGVYQYRGWTLVNDQPDLRKKTRAELDDIAVERGIDPARTADDRILVVVRPPPETSAYHADNPLYEAVLDRVAEGAGEPGRADLARPGPGLGPTHHDSGSLRAAAPQALGTPEKP